MPKIMTDPEYLENLIKKFRKLDADSNGQISFEEYKQAFNGVPDTMLEELWNAMNADKNDFISFEEFKSPK